MTVLFTDSGAGADANPIGGVYTTLTGFDNLRRLSNRVEGNLGNSGAYINSVTPANNQYMKLKWQMGSISVGDGGGPMVRVQTGSASGYVFQIYDNGGTPKIELARFDSGSYVPLISNSASFTPGDLAYIEAVGTTITAKINGVQVLQTTDATYASGRLGIYSFSNVWVYDTIEGGDFLSPSPPTPPGPTPNIARGGVAGAKVGARPGIPAVDLKTDHNTRKVLMALKENVEIGNGIRSGPDAWVRRNVTLGMLIKLGLITEEQARSVWQEP